MITTILYKNNKDDPLLNITGNQELIKRRSKKSRIDQKPDLKELLRPKNTVRERFN